MYNSSSWWYTQLNEVLCEVKNDRRLWISITFFICDTCDTWIRRIQNTFVHISQQNFCNLIKSTSKNTLSEQKCIIGSSGTNFYLQLSNKEKAYLQTLKFLPIPLNISMTPIHTKK